MYSVIKSFEVRENIPTINEVNVAFKRANGMDEKSKSFDLVSKMFDDFISEKSKSWTGASPFKYRSIRNTLDKYYPHLEIKQIN